MFYIKHAHVYDYQLVKSTIIQKKRGWIPAPRAVEKVTDKFHMQNSDKIQLNFKTRVQILNPGTV